MRYMNQNFRLLRLVQSSALNFCFAFAHVNGDMNCHPLTRVICAVSRRRTQFRRVRCRREWVARVSTQTARAACFARLGSRAPCAASAPRHISPPEVARDLPARCFVDRFVFPRSVQRLTASFEHHQMVNWWTVSVRCHGRRRRVTESVTPRGRMS